MGEDFRTDTFATGSHRDGGRAARYMAIEREKAELRRERDELVLRIAGDLGPRRLAASLGVTEQVCERMLAAARERQGEDQFAPGVRRSARITVRRLRESRAQELVGRTDRAAGLGSHEPGAPRPTRWADLDAYYERLGRTQGS